MQEIYVLVNELPWLNIVKFRDEVRLRLIPQAVVGRPEYVQDNIVDLELDLLALLSAGVPNHVNLAFQYVFLVEKQLYQLLGSMNELEVRSVAKHLLDNIEPPDHLDQLLDCHQAVRTVRSPDCANRLIDVLDALDTPLQIGQDEQSSANLQLIVAQDLVGHLESVVALPDRVDELIHHVGQHFRVETVELHRSEDELILVLLCGVLVHVAERGEQSGIDSINIPACKLPMPQWHRTAQKVHHSEEALDRDLDLSSRCTLKVLQDSIEATSIPEAIQAVLYDVRTVEVAVPPRHEIGWRGVGRDKVGPILEVKELSTVFPVRDLDLDILLMHRLVSLDEDGGHRDPLVILLAPSEEFPVIVVELRALLIVDAERDQCLLNVIAFAILCPSRLQDCGLVPVPLIIHTVNNVSLLKLVPPVPVVRVSLGRRDSRRSDR